MPGVVEERGLSLTPAKYVYGRLNRLVRIGLPIHPCCGKIDIETLKLYTSGDNQMLTSSELQDLSDDNTCNCDIRGRSDKTVTRYPLVD